MDEVLRETLNATSLRILALYFHAGVALTAAQ